MPAPPRSGAAALAVAGRLGHAEFLEDAVERAEGGEAALEQVGADEQGEPQPARRGQVGLAAEMGEAEGQHDEEAGDDADDAIDGHGGALLKGWKKVGAGGTVAAVPPRL